MVVVVVFGTLIIASLENSENLCCTEPYDQKIWHDSIKSIGVNTRNGNLRKLLTLVLELEGHNFIECMLLEFLQ